MKKFSFFALLLLVSWPAALAQTVINGVTITKPGQPQPAAPRRVVPAFVDSTIPADWIDVRGRISAGGTGRTDLPAGSRVTVSLQDASRTDMAATILATTTFPSASLPVSYQLVSSPRRFTSVGVYLVRVSIKDATGKMIYTSTTQQRINPAAKRILADVRVTATP
ncbi:hypothetical protein GCM10022631_21080 [Deinococcus rubellus]|uniref:YbaY family lipoprotein n=1 Tax=Deinococcus rubellus TaxID=1889240 RepID=A0ABY5YIG4_9DEIO|nr:YbaY family lipoprotein [Deinococcus rubellus]UWX64471.1 YbaY family lipoprotein [Deinococcus rubellus]